MATNLDIEIELLEAAMIAGGHKTEKAAVTQALLEYVQKRNQASIVDLFGTIPFDDDYNYKEERTGTQNAAPIERRNRKICPVSGTKETQA